MGKEMGKMKSLAQSCADQMRRASIDMVEVTYSGSGDAGEGLEVIVLTRQTDSLEQGEFEGEFVCHSEHQSRMTDQLRSDLFHLCDLAIDHFGHSGYEIDDGGGGTMKLKAEDASLELEHYDNYVHQEYLTHTC